ncbi:MAG: hypothetical protein ACK55I_15410, partial [bacterium]
DVDDSSPRERGENRFAAGEAGQGNAATLTLTTSERSGSLPGRATPRADWPRLGAGELDMPGRHVLFTAQRAWARRNPAR